MFSTFLPPLINSETPAQIPLTRSTGPTHPNWIEQIHLRPTYVDLVGMVVDKDGKTSIRLSILNRHPSVDWTTKLRFDGFELASAEVHEMYSDDLSAQVSCFCKSARPLTSRTHGRMRKTSCRR